MKTRVEVSAGGVIFRDADPPEVCLIATHEGRTWQLPKGLIEEGESREDAARREVSEETGLLGELVQPLDKIKYWYVWDYGEGRERVRKQVHFFLLRYTGGSTDDHDHEVDDARWFTLAEALERISFKDERRVLNMAVEAIEAKAG